MGSTSPDKLSDTSKSSSNLLHNYQLKSYKYMESSETTGIQIIRAKYTAAFIHVSNTEKRKTQSLQILKQLPAASSNPSAKIQPTPQSSDSELIDT